MRSHCIWIITINLNNNFFHLLSHNLCELECNVFYLYFMCQLGYNIIFILLFNQNHYFFNHRLIAFSFIYLIIQEHPWKLIEFLFFQKQVYITRPRPSHLMSATNREKFVLILIQR